MWCRNPVLRRDCFLANLAEYHKRYKIGEMRLKVLVVGASSGVGLEVINSNPCPYDFPHLPFIDRHGLGGMEYGAGFN